MSRIVIYNRNDGDASHASAVSGRLSNSTVSLKDNQGRTLKSYGINDATGKAVFEFKNSFEFASTSFTGPHTNKFIGSYTSGANLYTSETLAKDACKARDDCKGVTQEPIFTLRTGLTLNDSLSGEVSWQKSGTSFTGPHTNKFLAGYTSGTYLYTSETLAKDACKARTDCNGVTTELSGRYTLRTGLTLSDSGSGEVSWQKTVNLLCDGLLQQFHRFDEELSVQGKWQGGSVTGVCKGWGTNKVGLGFTFFQQIDAI